jgi:hypothetical protein
MIRGGEKITAQDSESYVLSTKPELPSFLSALLVVTGASLFWLRLCHGLLSVCHRRISRIQLIFEGRCSQVKNSEYNHAAGFQRMP